MSVFVETGHTPPGEPLTHCRILHARNRIADHKVKSAIASDVASGYDGDEWNGLETAERWKPFDNVVTSPSDLSDAAWTLSDVTLSGAGRVMVEAATTGQHSVSQTVALTAGTYIASAIVRFRTQGGVRLTLTDGTSTFTVDAYYDGTGSLQIASTGSPISFDAVERSDGTILIRLVGTVLTASGEIRLNMLDDGTLSYTGDTGSNIFVERISLHVSEASASLILHDLVSVTACCIQALNLGSTGGRIAVDVSINGGSSWTEIEEFTPNDDAAVMILFDARSGDGFRLRVIDAVEPEISVVRFGNPLEMPSPMYGGIAPMIFQRNVSYRTNLSETNEILGRKIVRNNTGGAFEWTYTKAAWARQNWKDAQRAFEAEPAFLAWRPETFPDDVAYGTVSATAAENAGGRDFMTLGASMVGYAHD